MKETESWTFESKEIADIFDDHVREQLPWYDMASQFVADIAACYLPTNGTLIDIGASTGNMSYLLKDQIKSKNLIVHNIEPSKEMIKRWKGFGEVHCTKAEDFKFKQFPANVYIMFLSLMFVPSEERHSLIERICRHAKTGSAIIIVDKCILKTTQVASKVASLAIKKRMNVTGSDYINKELSLRGIQVPTNKKLLLEHFNFHRYDTELIFQFGEFYGVLAVKECI